MALGVRRPAGSLTADEVADIHRHLCELAAGRLVAGIGQIGNDGNEPYGRVDGEATIGAAPLPFCVEVWAACKHASF